ncbi:MAG: hypothetical protein OEU57_10830 [Desulfuromonadales bacterium]|nr:hypothetical protein [Desulfuromonadales bacterium]MDH4025899.1 hypothetical protein [Desulfuromonadales bacterium]
MQKIPDKKLKKERLSQETPSFTKPVWGDLEMSCEDCNFNGQDIDTFPCAKCHTRH